MRPTTDVSSANLIMWLLSNIGVFIFQVGKSQVEGERNCIIRRAVWVVCILECVEDAGFNVLLKALHYDWSQCYGTVVV